MPSREPSDPLLQARAWGEQFEQQVDDPQLGWIGGLLLEVKATRTDDGLAGWNVADLDRILLEYFPSHVMFDPEDLDYVVPAVERLFEWLEATGRLPPARTDTLLSHVRWRAPLVRAALEDLQMYSPSKRMLLDLQARGYDLSDQASVAEAMQHFNTLSFEERGQILGLDEQDDQRAAAERVLLSRLRDRIGTAPPVVLPTSEELDAAARASVWYQRVRGLCEFVGPGRRTTDRGNLKLADGRVLVERLQTGDVVDPQSGGRQFKTRSTRELRTLDLTYELALAAGFLEVEGTTLRPLDSDELQARPRDALHRIAIALLSRVEPTDYQYGEDRYGLGWASEVVDSNLPVLLVDLFGRPGARTISDVDADVRQDAVDLLEQHGVDRSRWADLTRFLRHDIERAIGLLREVGLLEAGTGEALSLTPFGTWSVSRWMGRLMDVPVVGELSDATGEDLLRLAGDLADERAAVEIDRWIELHSAAELVAVLPDADETGQTLALRALVRAGAEVEPDVGVLAARPEVEPLLLVWRDEVLGETPGHTEDAERFVRVVGAVLQVSGSEAVGRWARLLSSEPAALVEGAWRVRLPQTLDVLAALGEVEDKKLAKTARKALFKHKSMR